MFTQILVIAWRPVLVVLVAGLETFLPDLRAGQGLQASLVDGGLTAVKVAGALLGVDRVLAPAVKYVAATRQAALKVPPSSAP